MSRRSSTSTRPTRARRAPRRSSSPTSSGSSASPCTSTASWPAGGRARSCADPAACSTSRPDFGPQRLHPTAGATLVAARPPLVAFNVEIDAPIETAKAIAQRLRTELDVRALGLQLSTAVQVSTNIEDHTRTTMADVVAAVREHATVTGAELVAPAPRAAHADFPRRRPAPRPGTAGRSSNLVVPMAQTKRKRRSKHRGNAAGSIEARGRTGRKPTAEESKQSLKAEARARRLTKPPTWNSAALKALAMAVLLFVLTQIGILGGDTSVQQGIILAAMAMLIYTPLAYMTDRWVYNKNLAKSQQPKT